ncbi:MAG: asparagine synthase (glutamine-hydrolyzing) [Chloroflexi bacterium]|nr:asparagine synthase (glutamine-hydrolyzing) [Chloroflexota bacterium]
MCGITGFWQSSGEEQALLCARVTRMADCIAHRGPDDSGVWVDAAAGLALGFRRLAILDLTPTGHQPMLSADGRCAIIFNGEIYNERELRAEAEARGVRFRGRSDTEVIVENAARGGAEKIIPQLWGMFALAIWDREKRELTLARDRLGKKPLYYAQFGGTFLFGSELKALRQHPDFKAEINRAALVLYLRHGYVPAPLSIYSGVYKLPAGHLLTVRADHSYHTRPYWDAAQVIEKSANNRLQLDDAGAIEQLDSLLRDSVARRMVADVPLGAFLSGGIDSSTVVALMQAQSNRPVKSFSIGFHIPSYNEATFAKQVALHLGTDHTELYVTAEEAQAVIPRLPDLYDEPFSDSSQIPTFLISQLARKHVTVALSGDGGDELFAGYNRYNLAMDVWNRMRFIPSALRRLAGRGIRYLNPEQWNAIYHRMEWIIPSKLRMNLAGEKIFKFANFADITDPELLYLNLISIWKTEDAKNLVCDASEKFREPFKFPRGLLGFLEQMMFLDLVTYLPDDILAKVDRASMGVSLEVRAPFLDHRVVEWVWRLPNRFKQRDGQSKWLLRQVLSKYVPTELSERPKMGFGVPIDVWLRGPLKDWAENLLSEEKLRDAGLFRPEPIRKVWASHLKGNTNEQYKLWAILMFQAWNERWMKAEKIVR